MSLFAELRRRNVVRVGIAYLLISWVLLQAADFFLDVIDAPNWVIQALLLVAVIGLPAVLIFAWIFEMTPEGVRLERDVDRSTSITPHTGRKLDRTIIVFLGLLLAWFLFDEFYLEPRSGLSSIPDAEQALQPDVPSTQAEIALASVAVLPFINMSDDRQNEYFSDGLTETLLHMLAQLPDLQVAARTSSFAFKGMNTSVTEIAAALRVAHILEGSVQKAGDRVRVTAQLVRADDGFHVWSQNYTRPMKDIFAIQDEIATDVADALGASLLGTGERDVKGVDTDDLTAYESWLRGLEEQAKFSYSSLPLAESHFKQALARDPEFSDARLSLIRNYILKLNTGLLNADETLDAVNPLLVQIRDKNPDSNLARAFELMASLSVPRADLGADELRITVNKLRDLLAVIPTETMIRTYVANTLANFFREFKDAEAVLQAGLLIDPLSEELYTGLGNVYRLSNRLEEARTAYLRSLELQPHNASSYWQLSRLEKRMDNLPAALEWSRRAIEVDPQDHELVAQLARDMYMLRLPEEGDRWAARAQALAPASGLALAVEVERAVAHGENDRAIAVAQQMIEQNLENRQDSFFDTVFLYANLMSEAGRAREAYEFIATSRPDVVDLDQLAGDFQGVILQWVSVILMSDFVSSEEHQKAWNQLAGQFDAMGFPWRDPEDPTETMDRVINGQTEAAIEAFLIGPLEKPLARNLEQIRRDFKHLFRDVYSDPRVRVRMEELDRQFEQLREEVIIMLQRPEWGV